ncbi:hypothetical protein CPB86DRAFT_270594 [Serendipita vermifera]|nr:hypothetical protein CPB86DRAFT_270594 [Serendipita vermifera]
MIQRAGIALSRLVYDADFSITRVNYDPSPAFPTFAAPTHHKLTDAHTVKNILEAFKDTIGFNAKLEYNGFLVSFPIGSSPEQSKAIYDTNDYRACDHFYAWATLRGLDVKKDEMGVNLLFIDLTPGQVASKLMTGNLKPSYWSSTRSSYGHIRLGDTTLLSVPDIYDKLVAPVISSEVKVYRVGILHPKGGLPGISNAEIEALFVEIPVDWVTLDELSHGAAFVMTREPTQPQTDLYIPPEPEIVYFSSGITLASGELVTVVPMDEELPLIRRALLTTSQDNQTTVTVRLNRDFTPFSEVKLEGLIPRPKGEVAIKVTVDIGEYGDAVMTVEEVGTDLKKVENLGNILESGPEADETYPEGSPKQIEMTFGRNGFVGELPE